MTGTPARLSRASFGRTPDGLAIEVITLRNRHGTEIRAMTYGGVILSITTVDGQGRFGDVVLGHDTAEAYFGKPGYFGAIVGRCGNRIARARFVLDGHTYELAANNGVNHLHGGRKGWNQAVWAPEPFDDDRGAGVVLSHTSPDGDEGYPGAIEARVTYTLTDANALVIEYEASTTRATVINLTQHTYFNLSAGAQPDILDHELTLDADAFTPVDEGLIPMGNLAPVAGTPFDFRAGAPIGARIDGDDVQLQRGRGYDHNFVINRNGAGPVRAARAVDPVSGRTLDVSTTEPGVQFYSGNFLDGSQTGKDNRVYGKRAGFCLETQHFPDSPNQPAFPSTVLRPGERFRSTTVFAFGVTG